MWNYRVIARDHNGVTEYGLYEVFYNDDGEISAHAETPEVVGDSVDELSKSLMLMVLDLEKHMVDDSLVLEHGSIDFKPMCDDDPDDFVEYQFEL